MSVSSSDLGRMKQWFDAVSLLQHSGDAYALVTVLGCTGSTPRDHSSKMVITSEQTFDTIGGGHLEHLVMKKARDIIAENSGTSKTEQEIHHFPLGASLGQCCGGSATVLIETFAACQFHIGIFGAGHVAKSIVTILAGIDCKVSWIDSREDEFPLEISANVNKIVSNDPCAELDDLPKGSDILILTHNHQLDFELCLAALKRSRNPLQQLRSIGLIGSQTKALRFQKRLSDRLLDQITYSETSNQPPEIQPLKRQSLEKQSPENKVTAEQIQAIRCPVGLSSVPGKLPMEVAVSIVGELIALDHASRELTEKNSVADSEDERANTASNIKSNTKNMTKKSRGLAWKDIKQQLKGELDNKGQGTVLRLDGTINTEDRAAEYIKQEIVKK